MNPLLLTQIALVPAVLAGAVGVAGPAESEESGAAAELAAALEKRKSAGAVVAGHDEKKKTDRARTIVVNRIDDGRTIEVKLVGPKIWATVDGDTVPEDRLKVEAGAVVILGKDGEPMQIVRLGDAAASATDQMVIAFGDTPGRLHVREQEGGEGEYNFGVVDVSAPPVMLGIVMAEPGEAVCRHLGLDAAEAVMVKEVHEGLPAAKAGLEAYDIIVAVDGRHPVSTGMIRTMLREREPGDVLEITAIHRGKKKRYELELATYDPSRMISLRAEGVYRLEDGDRNVFFAPRSKGAEGEKESFEIFIPEMDLPTNLELGEVKIQFEEKLEEAMRRFEKELPQYYRNLERRGGELEKDVTDLFAVTRKRAEELMAEHEHAIEERLGRMETRLETIESMIERLLERRRPRRD